MIVFVAALALGRFTVVAARDAAAAAIRNGAGADAADKARAAADPVPPQRATTAAGSRTVNRVKAVPVFRARRSSTAANAAAGRAAADSDVAAAKADEAKVEASCQGALT